MRFRLLRVYLEYFNKFVPQHNNNKIFLSKSHACFTSDVQSCDVASC